MRKRIAFDASCLVAKNKSGVSYYTEGLIKNLAEDYKDQCELIGHYCNFMGKQKEINLPRASNISYRTTKLIPPQMLNFLRRYKIFIPFELLIKCKADFHIFPAFIGWPSFFRTPSTNIIHDLTYLQYPEFVSKRALSDLKKLVPKEIKRSVFITTISKTSAKAIMKYYKVKDKNILITYIPPGKFNNSNINNEDEQLKVLGIKKPYILFIGNIEPRKNLDVLIDAYKLLDSSVRRNLVLVLAGARGWNIDNLNYKIKRCKDEGYNIILPGYINEEQRILLYEKASIFVLPSISEGFGITLLEAMLYQIPVIASDIPIFKEVCKNAALYFNPERPNELADQIHRILLNKNLALKQIKLGNENLKRYSWHDVTSSIFNQILQVGN